MGYRLGRRKTLFAIGELFTMVRGVPLYNYRSPYLDSDELADAAYVARLKAEEDQDDDVWAYD